MLQKLWDKVRGGAREGVRCGFIHLDHFTINDYWRSSLLSQLQTMSNFMTNAETLHHKHQNVHTYQKCNSYNLKTYLTIKLLSL